DELIYRRSPGANHELRCWPATSLKRREIVAGPKRRRSALGAAASSDRQSVWSARQRSRKFRPITGREIAVSIPADRAPSYNSAMYRRRLYLLLQPESPDAGARIFRLV